MFLIHLSVPSVCAGNPQFMPYPQSAGMAATYHSPVSSDRRVSCSVTVGSPCDTGHHQCQHVPLQRHVAAPYMHSVDVQELHQRLAESSAMCSELLRSQVQLVNMVSQRLSSGQYGMPPPGWPYAPYYSPYGMQPPGSDPASMLQSSTDYMQKLQQYHAALQEAHYRLVSEQSGPSSMGDREQRVGPVPPFGSQSINLPPPPPPPAGLFGSPYRSAVNFASPPTFNFAPRGFPLDTSMGNASHSNNVDLVPENRSPGQRLGASHLTASTDHGHHPHSPSGVTADSIQVAAPSSPQSAYSSVRPAQGDQEPFTQSGEYTSVDMTVHVSTMTRWT